MNGLMVAGVSKLDKGGDRRGVSVAGVNDFRGSRKGLTIGIWNSRGRQDAGPFAFRGRPTA